MSKVLVVCLDYYPYEGACTNLLNKMICYGNINRLIGEMDILTLKADIVEPENEIKNNIKIYRVVCWPFINKRQFKKNIASRPITSMCGIAIKITDMLILKQKKSDFIVPFGVIKPIINKLKKLMLINSFDCIIPITGDFSVAYAVWKFCKKTGVPYIVYQVDPIASNYNVTERQKKKVIEFEKDYFGDAKKIITTSIIKKEYKSDVVYDKMEVLEFPNVVCNTKEEQRKSEGIINCIFTGKIYREFRNPDYAISLFKGVCDNGIRFVMVGVEEKEVAEHLKFDNLICAGNKTIEETEKYIKEADFLVNIGNSMINQVPSKLFDYISTGKPIINVYKNKECPTLNYLSNYDYCISLFEEDGIEDNINKLKNFLKSNIDKRMSAIDVKSKYIDCTAEYCAEKLAFIINS